MSQRKVQPISGRLTHVRKDGHTWIMALRVLLADESSTIKKVMQLALQDFAVEVKAVPIGLDVLQVARSFNPDIVFVDVLLAKKNGYEVTAELKNDSMLKKTPVVLMWSGFMELDEPKAKACKVDRRLEKPFDAETLRNLVKELVPPLGSNLISNFLSFPEMPEMVEDKKPPVAKIPGRSVPTDDDDIQLAPIGNLHQLEEIEEPEEFQSVPLPKTNPIPQTTKSNQKDDWAQADLSRYRIELPREDSFSLDEADLTHTSIALSSGAGEISLDDIDNPNPQPRRPAAPKTPSSKTFIQQATTSAMSSLDPMRAEELLLQEARSVLESVAWKVLPEIVERVVREELQKLLKDAERL
jgi:two-component system, cell cycle response regulator